MPQRIQHLWNLVIWVRYCHNSGIHHEREYGYSGRMGTRRRIVAEQCSQQRSYCQIILLGFWHEVALVLLISSLCKCLLKATKSISAPIWPLPNHRPLGCPFVLHMIDDLTPSLWRRLLSNLRCVRPKLVTLQITSIQYVCPIHNNGGWGVSMVYHQ